MTKSTSIARSISRRVIVGITSGTALASLLVLGISGNQGPLTRTARAEGGAFRCHSDTLAGRYATRGDGFVPAGPPPAPMVPFAVVSLMTLDRSGNLTNDVTASTNGEISREIADGTYTLNADCKGTMTININEPPFQLNFDLVVSDEGKEFELIATTPSVVTVAGKRVD